MDTSLEKDVYVLGRQDGCDIKIDNLGVSRNHSRLIRDGANWAVEDLNSANGTFVNGQQVTRHILQDGDVITISKYEVIYSTEGGGAASAEEDISNKATVSEMGFDDNLNTMAMDGEALRKKFEEMNAAAGKEEKPARTTTVERNNGTAELNAKQAEIEMLKSELNKNRLLMVGAIIIVLAIVGAIFALR
ncbi:MAG: FHA domain-containing protein [Planctomycetota bacterium]|jgi:predicted component of type VI protein secretion system